MNQPANGGDIVPAQETHAPAFVPKQELIPVREILARKQQIEQILKSIMKPDVHYGVIPGTEKKTLLKPGIDLLMSTFQIAAIPKVHDLCRPDMDEVHIRVEVQGISMITGQVIGVGFGECSTYEKKYRWRRAVGQEYDDALETERRINYVPKNRKNPEGDCWANRQVRMEVGDISNTVLKMAKKRAMGDFVQTALAVSDLFGEEGFDNGPQDTSQSQPARQPNAKRAPRDYDHEPPAQAQTQEQRPQPQADDPINEGMQKILVAQLERTGVSSELLCEKFQIMALSELKNSQFNEATDWVRDNAQSPA